MDLKKEYIDAVVPERRAEAEGAGRASIMAQPGVKIVAAGVILAALQFAAMNGLLSSSFVYAMGNTLIYAIVAIGFCLLLGYSGLASLGTAGFIGLGAYTAFYLIQGLGAPYYLTLLATLMLLTSNLIRSPIGRAMIAMKNSTSAAQAMGISLMKYRLMAFVISTINAALGGLLYMLYVRNMTTSTSTLLTLTTSLNILGAVIIGGAKSLWGTAFGTFAIYGLQSMFLSKIQFFTENPAFITMVTGLLIIVVVMFFPGGFAQMVLSLRGWIRKRGVERRLRSYVKDQL